MAGQSDVMTMGLSMAMPRRIDDPLVWPLVPAPARDAVGLLWRLDMRLAEVAHRRGEPALVAIRLRWWADQLASTDVKPPSTDPILAEVRRSSALLVNRAALGVLAEAWGEFDYAARGTVLFAMTARLLQAPESESVGLAGALWSLVDQAARDRETGDWRVYAAPLRAIRLRALPRSLAALASDAARLADNRGVRRDRRDQWALFRVGLLRR